jgi:solute carrier family 35 protein C2
MGALSAHSIVVVRPWWQTLSLTLIFMGTDQSRRFLFATLLSVYNKWMFSPDRFAFPYPLFVTSLHMLVQFILAGILRYSFPAHFKPDHNPNPRDYV